jgi:hypothetical protein
VQPQLDLLSRQRLNVDGLEPRPILRRRSKGQKADAEKAAEAEGWVQPLPNFLATDGR